MLKDEASLSREKMRKIDLDNIIRDVVEEFKQNLSSQNKNINFNIIHKIKMVKDVLFMVLKIGWNKLSQIY